MSDTQYSALREMADNAAPLVRLPGGYWTYEGCAEYAPAGSKIPVWHVGVATVRSLQRLGYVERAGEHPEEWRDHRRITEAGRAALATCDS